MKRAGFTMIELIFVIVILGILAAVALPKFAGVSDQANAQKCNAWAGTLNRTIGPSIWSNTLAASGGAIGAITDTTSGLTAADVINYIALTDVPASCYAAGTFGDTNNPTAAEVVAALTNAGTSVTFGTNSYDLNFTDGNVTESPRWTWALTPAP